MKITLLCLLVSVGASGLAHANAGAGGATPSPMPNYGPPVKVTFNPKTISQSSTVDSIQNDFTGSTKTDVKLANGDHQVTLNFTTSGYPSGSGGGYEQDSTHLVLVVGPDGKVKSWAMSEDVYSNGVWGRGTDYGSSCFSDCSSGKTAKDLADASATANGPGGARNTIPVGGTSKNTPPVDGTTPAQQKSVVSGSAP